MQNYGRVPLCTLTQTHMLSRRQADSEVADKQSRRGRAERLMRLGWVLGGWLGDYRGGEVHLRAYTGGAGNGGEQCKVYKQAPQVHRTNISVLAKLQKHGATDGKGTKLPSVCVANICRRKSEARCRAQTAPSRLAELLASRGLAGATKTDASGCS